MLIQIQTLSRLTPPFLNSYDTLSLYSRFQRIMRKSFDVGRVRFRDQVVVTRNTFERQPMWST